MNKLCDNSGQEIEVGDIIRLKDYPEWIGLVLNLTLNQHNGGVFYTTIEIFDMSKKAVSLWHPFSYDLELVSKCVKE